MTLTSPMRKQSFLGLGPHGFHRIAYTEWGDGANPRVVICAHGLTRNGRDFDFLAEALQHDFRVVCPDVVGRGESEWLPNPTGYQYLQYLADMNALIARVNAQTLHWVGTSMGGLIGMMLAAQPNTPIARMVVNDVGPFIPKAALERIATYVGKAPPFEDLRALELYLRFVMAGFGKLTDAQWQHLALHSSRQVESGRYALRYDPGIAAAFNAAPLQDVDLWPVWAGIKCPLLLIRGADSDLLLAETALKMQSSRTGVELVTFADTAHAPALMDAEQIGVVRDFLLRH
jgi:pimeloyl-ACP methyl ester carboxylesterase